MSHLPFWVIMLGALTIVFLALLLFNSLYKAYRIFKQEPPPLPIIMTEYGPTTEWARRQAAIEMKNDPDCKKSVEELLIQQLGSREAGLAEAKRRYPECYDS